mgnify:CR=1 FL=1
MANPDTTRKLLDDLTASYRDGANNIGAQPDLTTWLARKLAQDRQALTSTATLYDGDDVEDELRTYVNALADNTTP